MSEEVGTYRTKRNKNQCANPKCPAVTIPCPLRIKYVVMALNLWERIEARTPFPLPVVPIGKSCGFMLVYDNLKDLRKDYPRSEYIAIKPAEDQAK